MADGKASGLGEVVAVWALYGTEAVAIYRTYRGGKVLPGGHHAGVAQVRIFLRHPTVAAGLATLPIVIAGRQEPSLAFAPWRDDDAIRLAVGAGLVIWSLPWICADLGIYVGDVPLVGRVFLSRHRLPPGTWQPAVHLGHHHGMDGALLALTALGLSRTLPALRPGLVRDGLSLYLAGLLVYGIMRSAEDVWNEQVVKRGWTRIKLPLVVRRGKPAGRRVWVGMGVAAVAIHRTWFRKG